MDISNLEKSQTQKSFALKISELSFLISGVSIRGTLFGFNQEKGKKIRSLTQAELNYLHDFIRNDLQVSFTLQKWDYTFRARGKFNSINPKRQVTVTLHFPYKINFKDEFSKLLDKCFLSAFNNRTKNSPFIIFTIDEVITLEKLNKKPHREKDAGKASVTSVK